MKHFNPVKIVAGAGCISIIEEHLQQGKWLLITSKSFVSRGVVDKIKLKLKNNATLYVYDSVLPNPELEHLEKLTRILRKERFTGIIGLGGGSAIDTAKVLSVTLAQEDDLLKENLKDKKFQEWNKSIFLIAVPTTSGTGAEVTPFATVWEKARNNKYSVTGANVYPDIAVLDPELTISLPREETLYTALDATSHALESLWNKNSTKFTAMCAWESLETIEETLPKLLINLESIELRYSMQYASLLAGIAISQTRTAIAHSISYPITMKYAIPHGLACSFTLPHLIKENLSFFPENKKPLLERICQMLYSFNLKEEIRKYTLKDLRLTISVSDNSSRISNYIKDFDLFEIVKQSQ